MKTTVFILLVVLVASATYGTDKPVRVEVVTGDTDRAQALEREPTPMMKEIFASQEATRLEIAALKKRYEATSDDQAALEIMREVAQVKRESHVEMMRIQLRYARENGDDELAVQLEDIVAKMTAPPSVGVPNPRPAPRRPAGQ